MSTPEQYRAKAAKYTELANSTNDSNEERDFRNRERSFAVLADNEQWLTDNHAKTVHAPEHKGIGDVILTPEEEHSLRCLGAALIMQWNTLPTKLQKELFANAGSLGNLPDTAVLRGQIARFLHKHKDGED